MYSIIMNRESAEHEIDNVFLYFMNKPDSYNLYWFVGYISCIADCGFIDRTTIRKLIKIAQKIHFDWR